MLSVERPSELERHVGTEIGISDWVTVDQAMIDAFAAATGDHQWIHVDVERAARELPGGKTIAHGYLTLSLLPRLHAGLLEVKQRKRSVNYGSNRVRFTHPVAAGSRVRVRQRLKAVDPQADGGFRVTTESTIEIEGVERPACVAETMSVLYG